MSDRIALILWLACMAICCYIGADQSPLSNLVIH